LADQLGQGTREEQVINAFIFVAEMTVRVSSPTSSQQIVFCEHTTLYHQPQKYSNFHWNFGLPQKFLWEAAFSSHLKI
jgi:hypothetical protein